MLCYEKSHNGGVVGRKRSSGFPEFRPYRLYFELPPALQASRRLNYEL